jgi:predicted aldo/keto reductase-like oxidoreductase
MHCLHPRFLELQLEGSLQRMMLDSLDIFYLQNPYEAQGPYTTERVFKERLTAAFEFCEKAVADGKIKGYGIATYSSLRVKPTEAKLHMNLADVHKIAEEVGGKGNHFKYVQLPCNVMMPEAFCEPWQKIEDRNGVEREKILMAVAADLGLNVIST